MSDAPERIWAFYAPHIAEDENGATIVAHETVQHGAAEYVRANMQPTASPDVAALVEAAFQEGFLAGTADGWVNNPRIEMVWKRSRARAALARVKGEAK